MLILDTQLWSMHPVQSLTSMTRRILSKWHPPSMFIRCAICPIQSHHSPSNAPSALHQTDGRIRNPCLQRRLMLLFLDSCVVWRWATQGLTSFKWRSKSFLSSASHSHPLQQHHVCVLLAHIPYYLLIRALQLPLRHRLNVDLSLVLIRLHLFWRNPGWWQRLLPKQSHHRHSRLWTATMATDLNMLIFPHHSPLREAWRLSN